MKRNFLVGVFFTVSVLIGFGQTLKTSLNPSIVNGKLQLAVVLENNTGQPIIPAESNFVAFFDTNFADYSSMVLFSVNPKWTDNDYYDPITLERLTGVEDNLFNLSIVPQSSILNIDNPSNTYALPVGGRDTLAVIQFDIKNPCQSADPRYGWQEVNFRRWEAGIVATDRVVNVELDPNATINFPYTGTPVTNTTISDTAYVLNLSESEVEYGWNPIPEATLYEVYVEINGGTGSWQPATNANSFTVGGLNDGDKVCFRYRAMIPECEMVESGTTCVIAFKCAAGFSGLRDVTETYCTSSFKDILEPDAGIDVPGSFLFEGAGVNFGAGLWYFDPQEAGAGVHEVSMIGCYGADTVTQIATVLPAPCSEVLSSSTINLPFEKPQGIFTSCDGSIYFTESDQNTIIRIDTFGIGHVVAGVGSGTFGYRDGHIDSALIAFPIGLVVHPSTGVLYFADAGNHAVRQYDPVTNFVTTIAGGGLNKNLGTGVTGSSGDNNFALDQVFQKPVGLAFNATYDSLYVADNENGKVKIMALDGTGIQTIAGSVASASTNTQGPALAAQMRGPAQLKLDVPNNRLYIGDDRELTTIRYLDLVGDSIKFLATPPLGLSMVDGHISTASHLKPIDVAPDGQGNLFVMENGFCGLRKIDINDTVTTLIGTTGVVLGDCRLETPAEASSGILKLDGPTALSVFVNGFVDIVDTENDRVLRYAIQDFINSPNKNLDSTYCVSQELDTINTNDVAGFYTSTPVGFVTDNGTHWVFDPSVDTGSVTVSFHHQVGTCQGAENRTVYVSPLPEFDLGTDTSLCANAFGVDVLEVDSALGSFQWSFRGASVGAVIVSNLEDTTHLKVIDSVGTYYLSVTSPFGCVYEDSIQISERNQALLQIASTSGAIGEDSVCFEESTVLTVSDNEPTSPGFASVLWSNGETTPSISIDTTGQYFVDIIDSLGCVASDTFTFVQKTQPTVVIDVTPSDFIGGITYIVCPQTATTLDGSSNDGVDYRWYDSTLTLVSSDAMINVSDTGKYYLEVEFADGCTGMDSVEIINYAVPVANIDTIVNVDINDFEIGPATITICPGDSVLLIGNPIIVGYSYRWEELSGNPLSFDTEYMARLADSYVLRITTDNGCEIGDTIVINHFSGGVNIDDETICIGSNHVFDPGAGFVSYTWSDNSGGQTLSVADSGMYSVEVVTTDGCSFADSAYLTVLIPDTVTVSPAVADTICDLESTLLTTTLSGTSSGSYAWTNGGSGVTNSVSTTGYQVVTFTDALTNCTSKDSVFIHVVARPQFDSLTVDSTICKRDTLPLYVRSVLASDSVFIYGLNTMTSTRTLVASNIYQTTFDGVDTSDIGTYVYVADNGFCTTESVSIINATDLQTTITPAFDTICFGQSIALSQLTSGGQTPYSYSWSQSPANVGTITDTTQPSITATPNNPGAINRYRLRVEDAVGCFAYDTANYYLNTEIVTTVGLSAGAVDDTIAVCGDGTNKRTDIFMSVVGGLPFDETTLTGKYDFFWYVKPADVANISINGQGSSAPTIQSRSPIPKNVTVYVDVTDAFGCTVTDSVVFRLRVINIVASAEHEMVCPGLEDSLKVEVIDGGSGDFDYQWFENSVVPEDLSLTNDTLQNTTIIPTISKVYTVVVTDNGFSCSVELDVPITVVPITGAVNTLGIICEGDTAVLTAVGNGAVEYNTSVWPYSHTYQWSKVDNGEPSVFVDGYDTTEVVQITAGTPGTTSQYQLIVSDSIGCMDTVVTNIQWNNSILSAVAEDTFYVCNDDLTQIFADEASGGVSNSNFNYNWLRLLGTVNLPDNGGVAANNSQNPFVFFNVAGASDTSLVELTVSDFIGCFIKDTAYIINNNIEFSVSPTFDTICANLPNRMLVAFLRDSNSTGNYTFNWTDPADASDLFVDSLGTIPTTAVRSPFVITDNSQTYELEITDGESGCSASASADIVIENIDVVISSDSGSIVCYLDQVTLTSETSGGTLFQSPNLPYHYDWKRSLMATDGSIAVSAVDSSEVTLSANGSEGEFTSWVLEVTDRAGCVGKDSTTLYWNTEIIAELVEDTVYVCNSETTELSVDTVSSTGGILPYVYSWSKVVTASGGAATLETNTGATVRVNSINNDTTVFAVTITDSSGCTATKEVVVIGVQYTIDAISSSPTVCQGIDVTLGVDFTGDIAGSYKYEWSPNIEINDTTLATPIVSPSENRVYTVSVYDSTFKCSATDSVEVVVLDLTAVASSRIGLDSVIMCFGQDNLMIDGTGTFGGTPPYTFSWNTFGSSEINVIGDTNSDTLMLERGIVSPIDTTLLVLTAVDFYGCTDIDSVAIYWNSPLQVNIQDSVLYSCDEAPKTLTIDVVSGGTGAYSYSWNAVGAVQLLSSTSATSLDVSTEDDDVSKVYLTVTDELGCQNTDSVSVEGVSFYVEVDAKSMQICEGINDTLTANVLGDGSGPYSYSWSPNTEINTTSGEVVIVTPTVDRTYTVVVYDSTFDCSVSGSTDVELVELIAIAGAQKGLDFVYKCFGDDVVTVDGLNSTFAGSPLAATGYTYSWIVNPEVVVVGSPSESSLTVEKAAVTPIDTTNLTLIIQNEFGCTDSDIVTIYWNSPISANIIEDSLYICDNTPKSLSASTPVGGTGAYTYGWSVSTGAAQLLTDTTDATVSVNTSNGDVSTIRLNVTDELGCVGFSTARVQGIDFQVTATATYSSVCAGLADTLSVAISNDGIGGYSYQWSPDLNIDDITSSTPIVTITTDTDYTVTVVDSTTGCQAQDVVNMTIYQFDAVAGGLGLDTLLRCYGETNDILLDASLTSGGTAPYTYSWSTTDPSVDFVDATSTPGVINRAAAGDGSISTIQLLVTDSIGCFGTDSIQVLWNSEIETTVTPDISNAFADIVAVCVGIPKTLNNLSVTGGSGNYSYAWADPISNNGVYYVAGTQTSATPTVGAVSEGNQRTLNVTITDQATSNGVCTETEEMVVRGYDINVVLTVDEDTVCPNTEINLSAAVTDNAGFVQYSWDNETTYTPASTSVVAPSVSSVASVYVRDTLTGCTNFDSQAIEVSPVVAGLPILVTPGEICYEERFITMAGVASGGKPGGYTFEWRELPFPTILSTNDTLVAEPPAVGVNDLTTYEMVVFDMLGCSDTIRRGVRRYDSIMVDAGDSLYVCEDGTILVGGSPTGQYASTSGDLDYSWSGGNFNNSSVSNPRYTPAGIGFFTLQVEVTIPGKNCSASDSVVVEVKELPIADFGEQSPFICADSSITLYANSLDSSYSYPSTTVFEWRKSGTIGLLNSDPNMDSLIVTSGGFYSVLVTDEFMCRNSAQLNLDSVTSPLVWAHPLDSGCNNRELILKIDSLKPIRAGELFGDTIRWTVLHGFGFVDEPDMDSTTYVPSIVDDFVEIKVEYINFCGVGVDTVFAQISESPMAVLDISDSTINITESTVFDGRNSISYTGNDLIYRWYFNAPGIGNEVTAGPHEKSYDSEGTYLAELFVYDRLTLCYDSAYVNVHVNGTHLLYVPNVFSPNATNPENRTLKMYGFGVTDEDFIFSVYNRWGEKVYEQTSFSQAISIGWTGEYKNTGEPLDMGVYTYIVRARYVDGTPVEKVGTITLLR